MSNGPLGGMLNSITEYSELKQELSLFNRRFSKAEALKEVAPLLLATLAHDLDRSILLVTPTSQHARNLQNQISAWIRDDTKILLFPETEILPFERLVSDPITSHERLRGLSTLSKSKLEPKLVISSATSLMQKTVSQSSFKSAAITIQIGQSISLEQLVISLDQLGYTFQPTVDTNGTASRKGGIIDVFPADSKSPLRIEFWGNRIETIRFFDQLTQRSSQQTNSASISPAKEILPKFINEGLVTQLLKKIDSSNCSTETKNKLTSEVEFIRSGTEIEEVGFYTGLFSHGSLIDYVEDDFILITCSLSEIDGQASEYEKRSENIRIAKELRGEIPINFPPPHFPWTEIKDKLGKFKKVLDLTQWGATDLDRNKTHLIPFTQPPDFSGNLDQLDIEIERLMREKAQVIAVTGHSIRVKEILRKYIQDTERQSTLFDHPIPGSVMVVQEEGGSITDGFTIDINGQKLVLLTDTEIFGSVKQATRAKRDLKHREALLAELEPGSYVVHVEHGIAKFVGTGKPDPSDNNGSEFLILHYAQGDKIYVPLEHLDRITPYVAPLDNPPSLTRLGGQEWQKAKSRAARSTQHLAAELLTLYASRELAKGHSFKSNTKWEKELEESFPYVETPDQAAAIEDVKQDMAKIKPMDRLICGDVGYGKTEIAIRAAFTTVMEGKQVAVLVPTTVLAQQHYSTFEQRLGAYPASIEVLSRFKKNAEQQTILSGLSDGSIDICIGTHRLAQKDVNFKQLGLIIVDEEQRFGVVHKERLRQLRTEVEVLTLTATPIPRTLHMSLSGVRDMSIIDTAPGERLPVKTYVSEFNDSLIREAALREIDRQGQVYFLHNRVQNIDYMAEYIKNLIPEASVSIAHGQMPEKQLEQSMVAFADGTTNILVCTTIIESGLDIPNVNTLIVNRADTFGLSQLYQLRGRVGRSARRAYSYFLIPQSANLTESAEKRLKAMLRATELGAGYQIAMKDLEIRGAGNILGSEQSGHIHAVGFNLYNKLLSAAVEQLRANRTSVDQSDPQNTPSSENPQLEEGWAEKALRPQNTPVVDINIPASIPSAYIEDLSTRLSMYRRLISLQHNDAIIGIEEEIRDRFGPIPTVVQNLFYVIRLKLLANTCGVASIVRAGEMIIVELFEETGGARQALQRRMDKGITVGNKQIRFDLEVLGIQWQNCLENTLISLNDFKSEIDHRINSTAH